MVLGAVFIMGCLCIVLGAVDILLHSISICIDVGGSICYSVHATLFSEIRPLVI